MKLIYEKSVPERNGINFPDLDVPKASALPQKYLRSCDAMLPEVSELDVVRHYTNLSSGNYSVDKNFYPLGSCTMKYNPKILEVVASLDGFKDIHPFCAFFSSSSQIVEGSLKVIYNLQKLLSEITGMDETTLQPMAGAQGELCGMLMIKKYHKLKKNEKKYVIIPATSHGTNPSSATMAGYEIITIPTLSDGLMDMEEFKKKFNSSVAAVILTCPNTLGIFNHRVKEICGIAHSYDALMYCDGANMNAILGRVKPADLGFDIIHLNLHKTFGAPHGGGGPGSGPVSVKKNLSRFLPVPVIDMNNEGDITLTTDRQHSIGQLAPFYGNFAVLLKAYAYILLAGRDGLRDISGKAVLNANYIMEHLKDYYELPYNKKRCMHECVFSAVRQAKNGAGAGDIAKYLIDKGIHPPTIYFPLIVKEAMMIEPTETESKETLDKFIDAMVEASRLAEENPEILRNAPQTTPVSRLDEAGAARELDVNYDK